MNEQEAVDTIQKLVNMTQQLPNAWSIVVLERGWIFVGKLAYDENGQGVLTQAANIRKWGTTQGLPELQKGPTEDTVLDPCTMPVRFTSSILILDALESGWSHAY